MKKHQKGFALLISILVSGIILAIGLSILTITLQEFKLSNIGRDSEYAFYAADAGLECVLYWDGPGRDLFSIDAATESGANGQVNCMGESPTAQITNLGSNNNIDSGETVQVQFDWDTNPTLCAKVYVTKYFEAMTSDSNTTGPTMSNGDVCPEGAECTIAESHGYNAACNSLNSVRVVERVLQAIY